MRQILYGLALSIVISAAIASVSPAQNRAPQRAGRVPVTIVLTDRTPPGSRFAVERIPTAARRDVIALKPNATAGELAEAVNALLTARQVEGDVPAARRTLRVRPTRAKNAGAPRVYPWAARVLADLQRAAPTNIEGIGEVRAVQIWLPRQFRERTRANGPNQ